MTYPFHDFQQTDYHIAHKHLASWRERAPTNRSFTLSARKVLKFPKEAETSSKPETMNHPENRTLTVDIIRIQVAKANIAIIRQNSAPTHARTSCKASKAHDRRLTITPVARKAETQTHLLNSDRKTQKPLTSRGHQHHETIPKARKITENSQKPYRNSPKQHNEPIHSRRDEETRNLDQNMKETSAVSREPVTKNPFSISFIKNQPYQLQTCGCHQTIAEMILRRIRPSPGQNLFS